MERVNGNGHQAPVSNRSQWQEITHRTLPASEQYHATVRAIEQIVQVFPGLRDHRIREALRDAHSPNEVSVAVREHPYFGYIR